MDDAQFGGAVPAFAPLRIQKNSLGAFGFGNGQNGLYPLKGSAALNGTALSEANFGGLLLPGPGKPRSVDLWPIFHTGVPNLKPYQLATGKGGNPLASGKPFISNFLPNGGDMLRLNMAYRLLHVLLLISVLKDWYRQQCWDYLIQGSIPIPTFSSFQIWMAFPMAED